MDFNKYNLTVYIKNITLDDLFTNVKSNLVIKNKNCNICKKQNILPVKLNVSYVICSTCKEESITIRGFPKEV